MGLGYQSSAMAMLAASLLGLAAATSSAAQEQPKVAPPKSGTASKAAKPSDKPKRVAKKAKSDEAGETKPIDPEGALDQARKALADGKADLASKLAGDVLASAGKTPRNTARALAVKGEAHLLKGRIAEAIVDLDGALWVAGGLQGAERDGATAARQRAMQQAGLGGQSAPAASNAGANPPGAPAPQTWTASTSVPGASSVASVRQAGPASTVRAAEARQEAVPEQASPTGGSGGIGSFFSKLFSGGAGGSQAPVTGTVAPPRPAISASEPQRGDEAPRGGTPPTPARAASAVLPKPVTGTPSRVAAPAVATAAATARPVPEPEALAAGVRIQLAAVRSREEAETLARRVKAEHKDVIGARGIAVEEEVYGNMGRFYRVRIGPFASVSETQSACSLIRNGGIDCMTVTAQ